MNATHAASVNGWPDEAALVRAAKEGEVDAFEELVERYSRIVFRVALHIARSREDAEEVVQETFLRAFQHLKSFEERSRIATWLTRITVNVALTRLRSLHRSPTVPVSENAREDEFVSEQITDWRPNPEQLYSRWELRGILTRALRSLPPGNSTVFWLRDVEGLSIAETAEALGLTESAVKTRLSRARLQLRERLSRYFGYGRTTAKPVVNQLSGELRSMVT
jgi:RNA polymerase sigma-70 factor, ECF subfamily